MRAYMLCMKFQAREKVSETSTGVKLSQTLQVKSMLVVFPGKNRYTLINTGHKVVCKATAKKDFCHLNDKRNAVSQVRFS